MRTRSMIWLAGVAIASFMTYASAALSAPPPFPGAPGQPFQALQSQIDDINADVTNLQAQIDSINTEIATLQADTANLQSQIDANSGDIATLQAQVAGNTLAIATLQATATGLQNQINFLNLTKQNNVTGSCPPQWSVRAVLPNGGVVCEFDDGEVRTAIFGTTFNVAPSGFTGQAVSCPTGWVATGGGHAISPTPGVVVTQSEPIFTASSPSHNAWFVAVLNGNPFSVLARATVMCALSLP